MWVTISNVLSIDRFDRTLPVLCSPGTFRTVFDYRRLAIGFDYRIEITVGWGGHRICDRSCYIEGWLSGEPRVG